MDTWKSTTYTSISDEMTYDNKSIKVEDNLTLLSDGVFNDHHQVYLRWHTDENHSWHVFYQCSNITKSIITSGDSSPI